MKKPKHSKFNTPALVHMRDVAFGSGMRKTIRDARKHSENLRDDEGLLAQAEAKRLRKRGRDKP